MWRSSSCGGCGPSFLGLAAVLLLLLCCSLPRLVVGYVVFVPAATTTSAAPVLNRDCVYAVRCAAEVFPHDETSNEPSLLPSLINIDAASA